VLLHRKTLLDDVLAQGELFNEDLYWTFKSLETVKEPEYLVQYIEDKKSEWEDGLTFTPDELSKFDETRYKHLLEAGKWKNASTKPISEPKHLEKEDSKFITLLAAVRELANSMTITSNTSDSQKYTWKFQPPTPDNLCIWER
jgi:hypothetical protein